MNYQRAVQETAQAQVVVVGAGLGGVAAAIASARAGADTMLIERNGYPGGVATAGHCCSLFNAFFAADGRRVIGGIPFEIACALAEKAGPGPEWMKHRGHMIFDVEKAKLVLSEMLIEAGVRVRFFTALSDVITADGKIQGLLITGRNGLEYIKTECVVDATGDSDVAALAGCSYKRIKGRQSYLYRFGNVDMDALVDYFRNNPEEYQSYLDVDWSREDAIRQYDETGTFLFPHGGGECMRLIQESIRKGEFQSEMGTQTELDALQMHGIRENGTLHIITGFTVSDSLEAELLTQRTYEGRKIAYYVLDFFKSHIPGMKNAYIASTADDLGVRFSRVITNQTPFTRAMQQGAVQCTDRVGKCLIILSKRRNPNLKMGVQELGSRCYGLPLSAMLPDTVDNLIMGAGRSISSEIQGNVRTMVNTMVVGQAAGTAAAVAALEQTTVRAVAYEHILQALIRLDAGLGDE